MNSLPEADIIVANVTVDGAESFVTPGMVRLLIGVSASSLRHDLGRKATLCARSGVPEYWVADVSARRIIRMHAPSGDLYSRREEFEFGDTIEAVTISGLAVDTRSCPDLAKGI